MSKLFLIILISGISTIKWISASSAIAGAENGIVCGQRSGRHCFAPISSRSPSSQRLVSSTSPVASSCSISDSAYVAPVASRGGESFRSLVSNSELPYNGSIRNLLRDWYYHQNLTSNAVASAAARFATTPMIIASIVFLFAFVIPLIGAIWHCILQRRTSDHHDRHPWSHGAVVGSACLYVLAVATIILAAITILGSFNSRHAVQQVQPTLERNLRQLDDYVLNTISDMNSTLVGRGRCLADYVDKSQSTLSDFLREQNARERLLRPNLTDLANFVSNTQADLSSLRAMLMQVSERLILLTDLPERSSEILRNLSDVCGGNGMVGDMTMPTNSSVDTLDACDAYMEWMVNVSTQQGNLEEQMSALHGRLGGVASCMQASIGPQWTSNVQALGSAASDGQAETSRENANAVSGEDWLRSVMQSMDEARREGEQFLNDTLGLPTTYSRIESMMDKHVEVYEDFRLVLSVLLLVAVMVCVVSIVALSTYAGVLVRFPDCGNSRVSRNERITLLGRTVLRLVTGSYICLTILLLTAGWFFIGASLLGSSCGGTRNMTEILENVVDNPRIWDDQIPLSSFVYRNSSIRYPLTVSDFISDCQATRHATLWRALHLEERQRLSQLTGQSVAFKLNDQPTPAAVKEILQQLKTYRHVCLDLQPLHQLWSTTLELLQALQPFHAYRQQVLTKLTTTFDTMMGAGGVVKGPGGGNVIGGVGPPSANFDIWLQSMLPGVQSAVNNLNVSWSSHQHRHAVHLLVNQTTALERAQSPVRDPEFQVQHFGSCTSDLMLTEIGSCTALPCLFQSTAHTVCGDYLSGVDTFWFFGFWTAVALWLMLLVATWLSQKYFVEPQLIIYEFLQSKAVAAQLLASVLFGVAWVLDLAVCVEFYRLKDGDGSNGLSLWLISVIFLVLSGFLLFCIRAVCWVLVDKASGCTNLTLQRNWVHRRHGWQFFGDLAKFCLLDIPFFALLVVYCHHRHHVGMLMLAAMIAAIAGICYFIVFVLIINIHNTRDYVSWVVDVSRDKRGMYTAHGAQMSPVSEELAQNGVELKMVTTTSGNQLSHLSDGLADPPSRDEVYESESECIGPMQHQNTEEQEAEDGEAEKYPETPLDPPSWTKEPEFMANSGFIQVGPIDADSERRRNGHMMRSMKRVQPAKVAPAPAVSMNDSRLEASAGEMQATSASGDYTNGPRSDNMAMTGSKSSLGRPMSANMTLDEYLSEWDEKSGNSKRKKYATWSEPPPASLMAYIEMASTGEKQLEGTSTFCPAPEPIIEEDPPPPESREGPFVLDSETSYAARTASLPTSERARKRYQQRLVSGIAGPDAERIRQRLSTSEAVPERQQRSAEYLQTSALSMDV